MTKTVNQMTRGEVAFIKEIKGGHSVRHRLGRLGLHPSDKIRVVQNGFFGGPTLIEVHGVEVGIGRGMAEKIQVDPRSAAAGDGSARPGRMNRIAESKGGAGCRQPFKFEAMPGRRW